MKWSLKLGRFLGIDVYLHFTFLLLLGFVGLTGWSAGRSLPAGLEGVVFFAGLFACVLLHEFGHALMARRYGIITRDITLLPIGGVARLERMPDQPMQEFWVALAGPAVNVVIALALSVPLLLSGHWNPLHSLSMVHGSLIERWWLMNVVLVAFNLLPAFPMDGGRVLRSILATQIPYARATRIAATIGQGMAILFGFAGLFGNAMLLFIALFVWIGASQEATAAEMKSSFDGLSARQAMVTDFRSLSTQQSLAEAARLLLAGSQKDFPIIEGGRLVGLLQQADLIKALRERGEHARVGEVMRLSFEMAEVDEPLESALGRANAGSGLPLAVLDQGHLAGLITTENVGELFMIRAALASRPVVRPPPLPAMPPVIGAASMAPPVITRREV
jgi:Zn-dependent protease/predicted transcriptional regulator